MLKRSYEDFSAEKCRMLGEIQERFRAEVKLDSYAHWYYDTELEILRLYNNDSDQVYFKYIPIGSFSFNVETWINMNLTYV